VTAAALAEKLAITLGTIYRGIADLQASRVPIERVGSAMSLRPGSTRRH
jgi:predicted DNA-binding transcriptional regulator YafY